MKRGILSFCAAAALAMGFTACNNAGETSTTTDSGSTTTTNTSTPTTTTSSVGSYAAMADSVERNSQQGYYLNPRTGKPYGSLKVDRTTGSVTDDAGAPVWRYVDRRNWWVYGGDNWGQIGEAQQEGDKLMYKGDGDKWIDYDTKWKTDDEKMEKDWKLKSGDTKIKVDGDEIKIKDGDTKTKIDKDGIKQKDN